MADQLSLRLPAGIPRLPVAIRPMLARPAARPFDSATHLFEPRWGGERALAFLEPDLEAPPGLERDVRILGAAGRDLGPLLPELDGLRGRVDATSAVLDGELVVVDRAGRLDAAALTRRLAGEGGPRVAFLVFDLLYLDGRPLLGHPLERRRATLRRVLAADDSVVPVPAIAADGVALHRAVSLQGIAGITARERRSPYLPGVRSRLWRSVDAAPDEAARALEADGGPADGPDEIAPAAPALALIQRLPFAEEE